MIVLRFKDKEEVKLSEMQLAFLVENTRENRDLFFNADYRPVGNNLTEVGYLMISQRYKTYEFKSCLSSVLNLVEVL